MKRKIGGVSVQENGRWILGDGTGNLPLDWLNFESAFQILIARHSKRRLTWQINFAKCKWGPLAEAFEKLSSISRWTFHARVAEFLSHDA